VIKPRTNAATSIPGLLSIFHNEWDALMLETATLRESLDARNKELATSLYQYDAACRVIARLTSERDDARAALAAAPAGGYKRGGDAMDVDGAAGAKKSKSGLSDELLASITATAGELSKGRKKRVISPELATPEQLASFAAEEPLPLHKPSSPGILALAYDAASGRFATAGADKTACVFDKRGGAKVGELKGHSKEVTAVAFAMRGEAVVTGSADKTVRLWAAEDGGRGGFRCAATFSDAAGAVTAVAVHPCGDVAATASSDGAWALYDLPGAACVLRAAGAVYAAPLQSAAFHPDGLILGTGGGDSVVRIWDFKSAASAATFEGHGAGGVAALAFSENGYHLATGGADGIKLWDLRKLKCFAQVDAPFASLSPAVDALAFDASGHYLAAGGAQAAVFGAKQEWAQLKAFDAAGAKKRVAALAWGPDARFLATGASGDHNLRVFAAPA
jgi:pre-mRNA-processing factor 19